MLRKVLLGVLIVVAFGIIYVLATLTPKTTHIEYGATFSALYAEELGLDWKETYIAMLDELGVKKVRIPAYWSRIERSRDTYDWRELDYQVAAARERNVDLVLAVGRRVPRWPECHIPQWAWEMPWDEQKEEIREFIRAVVERYKNDPSIEYWQVENEPYLNLFANYHCRDLDEPFLDEEIALVRSLDTKPILITDSGNLGLWLSPYKRGDAFGTSLYVYFWNPDIGQFKSRLPAMFYRLKERIAEMLYGEKPAFLIELSLEPWLVEPLASTPIETQLARMNVSTIEEILEYASRTSFERQYLWGVEWWYYMRKNDHPEFWEKAIELYSSDYTG